MKRISIIIFSFLMLQLEAAFVIKDGRILDANYVPTHSVEEHYQMGINSLNQKECDDAVRHFIIVTENFPNSEYAHDSLFYLGVSYYRNTEFDFANDCFTNYLHSDDNPKMFEEALAYKFSIANHFKNGAKKRIFGWKKMPKWVSDESLARDIFDEIISAVPCHELAARSLFAKAGMLFELKEFKDSIDVYQQLIKRFPKHELAPKSYLEIANVYFQQGKIEANNPDILALAQINLRRFQKDFPRSEDCLKAEKDIEIMKEMFAQALFETGQFYERKGHPKASILYYKRAIDQFPDTKIAERCKRRLTSLSAV